MALLITPKDPNLFRTAHQLPIPTAYVRITKLSYDKDSATVVLALEYFVSEEAAKAPNRPMPFEVAGLPTTITCPNPLQILATASAPAYLVAYEYAKQELQRQLGNTGTVTDSPS